MQGIDFNKHIHITFIGGPAVDAGGPLREFLFLLIREITSNNSLFCGEDENRVPLPNVAALEKELYRYVGQMIAVSLVHGGPAPTFFAPSVIDYFIKGIKGTNPRIGEVPSTHIRRKLEEVSLY